MSQIDQTALDNIRALQQPEAPDLVERIVGMFVTQAPVSIKTILDSVESGDLETIRLTAHSLKSSAAYVGATSLSKRLADLETVAREGQLDLCQELCFEINDHALQVIDELDPYLNQDKAA